MPSRARFSAGAPYNALPPLPPRVELETKPVMKALVGARAALAELKQAGELIPNQSILINTLPVLEARASSEIENIVTTADRLFRFAQDDESDLADPATKEALRYQSALMHGLRELARKPVTTGLAVGICRTLRGIAIDVRKVPGTALRRPKARTGSVVCWPTGNASCTTRRISIRCFEWPSAIINSRRFIRSRTATAAPAGFSICCSLSNRVFSTNPFSISAARSSAGERSTTDC
jgi:hypothetical protein